MRRSCSVQRRGPHFSPRHSVQSCHAACQHRTPFSRFSAGSALLPGRPPCPTSPPRPLPAASRCVVAHDAVISPRALPHRVARASRSSLPGRKDAAHAVALRRGVPSSSVSRGVTVCWCALRCDCAVRLATLRCSHVLLRSCGVQRCGPRRCAAPRRPKLPAPPAKFASLSLDSPPATPCCPAGRVFFTSVARGVAVRC